MTQTAPLIRLPEEITAEWLGAVLGRGPLELHDVQRIGTGQMSQSHRATFSEGGGERESVVVKLASDDPTSRATGVGMGAYSREVRFYQEMGDRYGAPLARCHLAEYDHSEGWFTLVLADAADAEQGDQVAGCAPEQARRAVEALAALHAPVLGDLGLAVADWLNLPNPLNQALHAALLPGFLERYEGRLAPEHVEVLEQFVARHDAWMADQRPPLGLVHGDFRLDNLLFGPDEVTVVDWQTVSWGPAVMDLSYLLGTSLSIEDRRAHEEDLVRAYHEGLVARGAHGLDWDTCWTEYRRQVFHGLLMATIPAMVVVRTDRGDDMFMAVFARVAQQAIDLGSLELLPEAVEGPSPHLRPEPADEGRHEPGQEDVWNESWYFDGVSDDGSVGVYLRLGRLPNQGVALYTACVCGPDRPTVMLLDGEAPLPPIEDDEQRLERPGYRAAQHCEAPLERFRLELDGTAASHADAAGLLREEAGEEVRLALDLTWATDGEPYRWRIGARYEIPCRVTGTITVGDETIEFAGRGQRDHSWGARDWWGADWMWSAFHLDDGTHTHLVTTPSLPGRGIGYVQHAGSVAETGEAVSSEQVGEDGLVTGGRVEHASEGLALDVTPRGYGPILLRAPDGRVTHFIRAMADVRAQDGRTGTGWIEWNRNQPRPDGAPA